MIWAENEMESGNNCPFQCRLFIQLLQPVPCTMYTLHSAPCMPCTLHLASCVLRPGSLRPACVCSHWASHNSPVTLLTLHIITPLYTAAVFVMYSFLAVTHLKHTRCLDCLLLLALIFYLKYVVSVARIYFFFLSFFRWVMQSLGRGEAVKG